jgi:TPR repeat protein
MLLSTLANETTTYGENFARLCQPLNSPASKTQSNFKQIALLSMQLMQFGAKCFNAVNCLLFFDHAGISPPCHHLDDINSFASTNAVPESIVSEMKTLFDAANDDEDVEAMYRLGKLFEQGQAVKLCSATAIKYIRRAANQRHAQAQQTLGLYLLSGFGTTQEPEEAVKHFQRAANQGLPDALLNLALCYNANLGVSSNDEMFVQCLKQAADKNVPMAALHLSDLYHRGDKRLDCSPDTELAIKYLGIAAKHRVPEAFFKLGTIYQQGSIVSQDALKAIEYFKLALELGCTDSAVALGDLLATKHSQLEIPDFEPAFNMYLIAADLDNAEGQLRVSQCYLHGFGAQENRELGMKYLFKAVQTEHAEAIRIWNRLNKVVVSSQKP